MYIGSWKIDDLVTFTCNTHTPSTGAATDADAAPTYRVYEDETGTPILTGTMALLDSANTAGFYSEQIALSAANGFEKGKSYNIYITATVGGIAGTTHDTLQVEAEVDANAVSDKTGYALSGAGLAAVNAEVLDVLTVDTFAEPAGVPAATSTIKDKLNWLFALARNKRTTTSAVDTVRNDADTVSIATSAISDDGTTFTRSEYT